MHSRLIVIALAFSLLFSGMLVFAQENVTTDLCAGVTCDPAATTCPDSYVASCTNTCSGGTCSTCVPSCSGHEAPADPCAGITCSPATTTCPDSYVASCSNTCSGGTCSTCTPSCAGHDAPPAVVARTCPPISPPSADYCHDGTAKEKYDANGCVTGYECIPPSITACPTPPAKPSCPADAYPKPNYDSKGCITDYKCEPVGPACPTESMPFCASGYNIVTKTDAAGCAIYKCEPSGGEGSIACARVITPAMDAAGNCKEFPDSCLPPGWYKVDRCPDRSAACGNNICEPGEENFCRRDCISAREACPVTRTCADSSRVMCRQNEDGSCFCEACPIESIPQGCRQVVDKEKGFVGVVCESRSACPATPDIEDVKNRCEQNKGIFSLRKSPDGCEFPDCTFGGVSSSVVPVFNPLQEEKKCPAETNEQREATRQSCEKLGLHFAISVQGGCKVSKCSQKSQKLGCEPLPFEERQGKEDACRRQGLNVVKDFDESGCPLIKCGEPAQCPRDVPKEAYQKCGNQGGELVVRRDNQGCITLSQCIVQGDSREADVDPIERMPEPSELLSMAFRMEELKIELDKLAKKTDDIAGYYASTGSPDEGRYRRVSDMFDAAKDKVDEIKEKLRDAVQRGDVMEDDLIEVKRDVKYIKNVMMKDILYLMLSSSDDVKNIKESRATKSGDRFEAVKATDDTNCGSDGSCFDRGFRLCKKLIFYPEGSKGPKVEVQGLSGNACIMYVVLPEGEGPPAGTLPGISPPYDMTCKIEKYTLGVRNPEEDIFPYCEGSMAELTKKFGGSGGQGPPGVPGKCSGDECRDYCGRGPEEAKECLEELGPYLPPEAKQGLEQLARGEQPGFGGFQGPPRETGEGFERPSSQSATQPCGDGLCDDFEQRNPDACPQDCRGSATGVSAGIAPRQPVTVARPVPLSQPATQQACSGCLNNGVCDPGECSECADCLRG